MTTNSETGAEQVFHPDRDAGLPEPTSGEVKVTVIHKSPRKMSARSAVGLGVTLSAILAAVFWTSYSLWSFITCSGLPRQCPASWIPYAIVATTGFIVMVLLGAFLAWAFYRLYGVFRVD